MASSYTKLDTWLSEAMMRSDLNGREFRILIAIIRCTKGYHRNSDEIAYIKLSKMTGISRNHCVEIVKSLEEKKWISVKRRKRKINLISLCNHSPEIGNTASPESGTKRIPNSGPIIDKGKNPPSSGVGLNDPTLEGKDNKKEKTEEELYLELLESDDDDDE